MLTRCGCSPSDLCCYMRVEAPQRKITDREPSVRGEACPTLLATLDTAMQTQKGRRRPPRQARSLPERLVAAVPQHVHAIAGLGAGHGPYCKVADLPQVLRAGRCGRCRCRHVYCSPPGQALATRRSAAVPATAGLRPRSCCYLRSNTRGPPCSGLKLLGGGRPKSLCEIQSLELLSGACACPGGKGGEG